MNTEEIPYSQFDAHLAKLRAEGKRASVIIVGRNGYRIVTTNIRPSQPELLMASVKEDKR